MQTLLLVLRPQPFLAACRRRHGDLFTLRVSRGAPFVIVASPALVKEVFTGPPAVLRAGEANAPLGALLGDRSVLLLDGPEHLRQRKLLLPPFHGARMRAHEGVIERATWHELETWPVGRAFPLLPAMQEITLEVIIRAVFGVHDAARFEELSARLRAVLEPMRGRFRMAVAVLTGRTIDDSDAARAFIERRRAVDDLIFSEIAARRLDPGLADRDDILSMLLLARDDQGVAMTDAEVRDELVTLLVAGHETTATALAWAFERLLRTPAARAEAKREAAQGGETPWLDAIVKETLRVRPILANVGRVLGDDFALGGHVLPAGVTVLPSITLVHRRADAHPAPGSFRPQRWLDGEAPDAYAWIPFGGGTRRCLGASFAQFEMRTVLRTVLAATALEPSARRPEKVVRRGLTLAPQRGARVIQLRPPRRGRAGLDQAATARDAPPVAAGVRA